MKKSDNIKNIILVVYLQIILVIYFWFIYPALIKPENLSPTNIPSISITGLKEVEILFNKNGKSWLPEPNEPNLNNFSFGQTEPI